MLTLSPTLTPSRFFLSLTSPDIVRPSGVRTVTDGAAGSIASIVTVRVCWRVIAPLGFTPLPATVDVVSLAAGPLAPAFTT
jgi:hypothetical protein